VAVRYASRGLAPPARFWRLERKGSRVLDVREEKRKRSGERGETGEFTL
jgi:hypothetical protein